MDAAPFLNDILKFTAPSFQIQNSFSFILSKMPLTNVLKICELVYYVISIIFQW